MWVRCKAQHTLGAANQRHSDAATQRSAARARTLPPLDCASGGGVEPSAPEAEASDLSVRLPPPFMMMSSYRSAAEVCVVCRGERRAARAPCSSPAAFAAADHYSELFIDVSFSPFIQDPLSWASQCLCAHTRVFADDRGGGGCGCSKDAGAWHKLITQRALCCKR